MGTRPHNVSPVCTFVLNNSMLPLWRDHFCSDHIEIYKKLNDHYTLNGFENPIFDWKIFGIVFKNKIKNFENYQMNVDASIACRDLALVLLQ